MPAARYGARPVPPDRDRPPAWELPALTALARWVPEPPRSRAGRWVAYLWAAPLTLAGVLAGAASATLPRRRGGVVVFAPARGAGGAYLRRRGFSAMTLGHAIIARTDPGPALLAHELVHARQAERFGLALAPLYLALYAVYGYHRHPLERAARLGAASVGGAG